MSSRYWGYVGPQGEAGPVSTDELALFLRERLISIDTPVCPVEGMHWAPLSQWLPELAPFGVRASAALPPPAPRPGSLPPPTPFLSPWESPVAPRPAPPAAPEAPFALTPAQPPVQPALAKGWTDRKPHPWRRYAARMLDLTVVSLVMGALLGVVGLLFAPEPSAKFWQFLGSGPVGKVAEMMLSLLLVIPGNALLLGLTGGTLGKWMFGVKIVRPDGRPIGVLAALWREIRVWFQGLAMGIPFVSLFTLFAGFSWLKDDGHAPWDKPRQRIALHRPAGAWQVFLALVGLALLIAVRVWTLMPAKPGA